MVCCSLRACCRVFVFLGIQVCVDVLSRIHHGRSFAHLSGTHINSPRKSTLFAANRGTSGRPLGRAAAKEDHRSASERVFDAWSRLGFAFPIWETMRKLFRRRFRRSQTPDVEAVSSQIVPATPMMDQLSSSIAWQPQWNKVSSDWTPDPYRIARRISPLVVMHTSWSVVVVLFHLKTRFQLRMPSLIHPLMVGLMGLLLAFRTNQAFERHWGSCRAWAELHQVLHTFVRLAGHMAQTDYSIYAAISRHITAYPIALKQRLRRRKNPAEFYSVLDMSEIEYVMDAVSPHLMLLTCLSMLIRPFKARDFGDSKQLAVWQKMDNCISEMQAITCNLDIVINAPLPSSYSLHTSRFLFLWVGTLPFGLVGYMSPYIVPMAVLCVAWALFSTEELAQLMEEPFGRSDGSKPETVPLDELCRRIIVELKQALFLQNATDRRVAERQWVIKPEDLIEDLDLRKPMDIEDIST